MSALPAPCMTRLDVGEVEVDEARGGDEVGDALHTGEEHLVGGRRTPRSCEMPRSLISSSRSFGTTMRVSTSSFRGCDARARPAADGACPRSENGLVTTPMVSAPIDFAIRATTGAPPVPVPPPSPAVTKTMSAPASASSISSAWSSAARRPTSGSAPAPSPRVSSRPTSSLTSASLMQQRLRVRVDGDELDAAEAELDHAVDGVDAAAADADDLDHGEVVLVRRHEGAFHPGTFNL